jgi:Undecaprenyl-phosphate glucose phosphotransferase
VARQVASQYRRDTMSPIMVSGVLRMVEFAVLFLSGLCVYFYYVGFFNYLAWQYPLAIMATSFLAVVLFDVTDCYQVAALMRPLANFGRVLLVWAGSFALMALTAFAIKASEDYSRLLFGTWFVTGFVLIFGLRLVMSRLIRRWARDGRMERRALIVGGGKAAEQLIRSVEKQPYNDIRICGIFDDRSSDRSPTVVAGYPKLGTFAELVEFARLTRIDMLIIALPATAEARILQLLRKLWILPVDIRLAAHAHRLRFRPRSYSHVGAVPMFDIFDKPIRDWDSVAKRSFDIVFTLLAIALLWPVMLIAAAAVKLNSKGPALFRQKRHGFNNEVIEVLKFRSMYTDMSDQTAVKAVTKGDPRVTSVGRFLRKSSVDELPQLFNVLKGELSLVGPRPHAVQAQTGDRRYVDVVDGYFARHRVKPGVTGWAQINGLRGELDSDEKIRARTQFDLDYIENWSLFFDLKILLLTPIRLLNTDNAY